MGKIQIDWAKFAKGVFAPDFVLAIFKVISHFSVKLTTYNLALQFKAPESSVCRLGKGAKIIASRWKLLKNIQTPIELSSLPTTK